MDFTSGIVKRGEAFPGTTIRRRRSRRRSRSNWGDELTDPGSSIAHARAHGRGWKVSGSALAELYRCFPLGQANDLWIDKAEKLGQAAICALSVSRPG